MTEKVFVFLGILFLVIGLIFILGNKYLGKLPGDVKIDKGDFKFYFPIGTSIVISIILSLVLFFVLKIKDLF
ncbi:DUF2905 domain-containing protein [Candidatus Woesearchaeota archaeon]|nr:DUF2905 domain-containing protein [Candidatus Woesearchaeota archaeon]